MSKKIAEIRELLESGIHDCCKLIAFLQTDDETFEAGEDLDKAVDKLKHSINLCDALDVAEGQLQRIKKVKGSFPNWWWATNIKDPDTQEQVSMNRLFDKDLAKIDAILEKGKK